MVFDGDAINISPKNGNIEMAAAIEKIFLARNTHPEIRYKNIRTSHTSE